MEDLTAPTTGLIEIILDVHSTEIGHGKVADPDVRRVIQTPVALLVTDHAVDVPRVGVLVHTAAARSGLARFGVVRFAEIRTVPLLGRCVRPRVCVERWERCLPSVVGDRTRLI